MLCFEKGQSFIQQVVLVIFDERGACPDTLLLRAGSNQRYGTYTIVNQLFHQLSAGKSGVSDGEVESVCYRIAQIAVIYQMEPVFAEYLFQLLRPAAILFYLCQEVVCSVRGGFQHRCHGVLGRVAYT